MKSSRRKTKRFSSYFFSCKFSHPFSPGRYFCHDGADLHTVSKLPGHANIRTTQVYAKIVDESKRRLKSMAISAIPVLHLTMITRLY
ncbi:MAG TPA: hypothetical protein IAC03_04050 [Candidatus Coprenecus pullistercoris]|nr:hypothetical protein [Candidatus Coprenecus pullistercoris]